jgi:hypothetical protein
MKECGNSFTLFSFQLDILTILYTYNLGSFICLYMFRTDRSIIRRSNAFIAHVEIDKRTKIVGIKNCKCIKLETK